ncbi:hypothetical protein, partial [Infirmifilum sp.]|uniref:hypothetical protein n=1 Tax=Infirmifilum sp. TaxID=2856575 RepID=UPI003D11E851
MPGTGKYGCIILTTRDWFDKCLKADCKVIHFPAGSDPRGIDKLTKGSVCLLLAKPSPKAPRSKWEFLGEFTVVKVDRVSASEFKKKYSKLAIESGGVPFPSGDQWCWVIQFSRLVKYGKLVKLGECGDIVPQNRKPLSEWRIAGFTLIRPENTDVIINSIRDKAGHVSMTPSHDKLVKMIRDIGEWMGFVVEVDEETPGGHFKLDVTWRVT